MPTRSSACRTWACPELEVDRLPAEAEQLRRPQPRGEGQVEVVGQGVALGLLQEAPDMLGGQRGHLGSAPLRERHAVRRVDGELPPADRLGEGLAEHVVGHVDGPPREAALGHGVDALDLDGPEIREARGARDGPHVRRQQVRVVAVGAPRKARLLGREPAVEVLVERLPSRRGQGAGVKLAQDLRELLLRLELRALHAGVAVDALPFGPDASVHADLPRSPVLPD